MVKTVTPFSTRAREGATDSPLGDYVDVDQAITSIASAGFYDENGKLTGNVSSDRAFVVDPIVTGLPNGAAFLSPQFESHQYIDMTGFSDLFFAINPSRAGNYAITAVMGIETDSFANLTPVNAASNLIGVSAADSTASQNQNMNNLFIDTDEALTADVWNIFIIQDRLRGQKLLQFKITNSSGGDTNYTFASMRVV